jgi:hypothetical protein
MRARSLTFVRLGLSLLAACSVPACYQILGGGSVELWPSEAGSEDAQGEDAGADGSPPPSPVPEGGADATPPSPDASIASDASDAAASDGATLDCGALAACGAQCVSLATSEGNCGACGHSCGTGDASCVASACQPVLLFADTPITGLAVDQGKVYVEVTFDGGGYNVLGVDDCPTSGCTSPTQLLAPDASTDSLLLANAGFLETLKQQGESEDVQVISETSLATVFSGGSDQLSGVVAQAGIVLIGEEFNNGEGITVVILGDGGVASSYALAGGNGFKVPGTSAPFGTDGKTIVFAYEIDGGSALSAIPVGDASAPITQVSAQVPSQVNVYGGQAYLTSGGTVTTCPLTGCTGAPAPFVTLPLATIVATAVDASGLYWIDSTGAIGMCPLTGCPSGAVSVVKGLPAASLVLYDGFVYFYGVGSNATNVYKVAEPAP